MPETRRKYDKEFREGAVRIVRETGKPPVEVARDLDYPGTLGRWVNKDRLERGRRPTPLRSTRTTYAGSSGRWPSSN
jgi:transposase